MQADKLEQNEKDRGKTPPRTGGKKQSTSSYNSLPRSSRQSRVRSNSVRLPSSAPSVDAYGSKLNWKNSLRSSDSPTRSYRAPRAPQTPQRKISRPQMDSVPPNDAATECPPPECPHYRVPSRPSVRATECQAPVCPHDRVPSATECPSDLFTLECTAFIFFNFIYTIYPYDQKKIKFEKGGPLLIKTKTIKFTKPPPFIQTDIKLVRMEPNFDTVYLLKDYI